MAPPKKKDPKKVPEKRDSFSIYGKPAFYALYNLENNEKNKTRFIKIIESFVRSSHEYRHFLAYLKQEAKLTYCAIMNGLGDENLEGVTLEIHHYPYTLYDITEAVLNRHLLNNLDFSRLSIANEVMSLHFNLQVGLVPLTLTMHQMAHTGNILIDMEHVFGDYKKFSKDYELFLSEEAKGRYMHYFQRTKNKELIKQFNMDKLMINPKLFQLPDNSKSESEAEEQDEDTIDEDF